MLYGRDAERARIGALLDRARGSRSGVLVLRGEPGVGKTALLEDTADRASDMRVLSARGVESESELPFATLHRLLRPALDHLDRLPAPQAAALGGALGLAPAGADERFLVYAACLSLLAELAEPRPVLCLVDDAHWLDAASADALLFVARRLGAEGIVMLFGARELDVRRFEADDLPSLEIGGIDADAAAVLLAQGARHAPAPAVRERLMRDAHGNALALLELPATLTAAQLAGEEALPAALPLTRQLERAFLERVRRLPAETQRLLLLAAADDTERLSTLARALQGAGIDAATLDDVERTGLLLIHGTRVEFRHPLVRSAIYGGATARERAAAHAILAEALAGDAAEADRRAWHLAAAALEPDEHAVRALEEAAERALDRAGHPAAARALERAAELTADPAARGRRLVAAARAASLAGRTGHAVALAERAAPVADGPELRAEIVRVRALAASSDGRPRAAHHELLRAAREVGGAKAWELLRQAADTAREVGDARMVLEVCQSAEAIPDLPDTPALEAIKGIGAVYGGEVARGLPMLERAAAAAEGIDDPRELITIGVTVSWLGRLDEAERLFARAAALARSRGAMATLCQALAMAAPQLLLMQRFDEASVAAAEAVTLCRDAGFEHLVAFPLTVQASVHAAHGRAEEARPLAEEALRIGVAYGSGALAGSGAWALAALDVNAGRWQEALERLLRLAAPAPGVSTPFIAVMSASDRVEMASRTGRMDVARAALAQLEAWAAVMPARWPRPLLECCRALVAEGAEATARFEAALEHIADARPLDRARIRLLYGEHLRRERRRVDARAQLRAALEDFERLNAATWAERARAELRASGETARRRDPSTLGDLTPQELQVAQLVASGLSNKEVAAQLFLSPRTIEAHLRGVFGKLGVTSRTQLARLPQFGDHTDASIPPVAEAPSHAHR